ncbi:unnamed protein product [Rhodiola kirilowii]
MCRQDAHLGLSDEEEVAAEQSFSVYCRPVEFYNILKCRAEMNPPYLQRSLSYKIQAKHKTRINLTVKVPEILSTDGEVLNLFPLHVLLRRRIFDGALVNDSHDDNFCDYNFSRLCVLRNSQAQGNFVLPDVTKLAEEATSGSLYIVFPCQVEDNRPSNGNLSSDYHFVSDGHGLCGKLSLDLLFLTWGRSDSWASHQAAEMTSVADLHPSFLKWDCTIERKTFGPEIE